MLILGLTGGIATGKSTVSKLLSEHGVPIIDADVIAREVVAVGTPAYREIVSAFSESTPGLVVSETGELNRPALGRRIFNDHDARRRLNGITHPAVRKSMALKAMRVWMEGHGMVVMDVPLLFESGLDVFCGTTVVVACSDTLQMKRLMARDAHLTQDDASSRVASQMPVVEKSKLANVVIDNDGSLEDLKLAVEEMILKTRPSRTLSLLEWLCPPFGLTLGLWTLLLNHLHRRNQRLQETQIKAKL